VLQVLAIGWPMYLMRGASGGPSYGTTNHFWPFWPFIHGAAVPSSALLHSHTHLCCRWNRVAQPPE